MRKMPPSSPAPTRVTRRRSTMMVRRPRRTLSSAAPSNARVPARRTEPRRTMSEPASPRSSESTEKTSVACVAAMAPYGCAPPRRRPPCPPVSWSGRLSHQREGLLPVVDVHEALAYRPQRSLSARREAELSQDVRHMRPSSALTDAQLGGDLLVRSARAHQREHLELPAGECARGVVA